MRIDIIRQPLSVTLVLFLLLAGLFWYRFIQAPLPIEIAQPESLPIASWLTGLAAQYPFVAGCAATVLLFFNALGCARIVSRNMAHATRSYIPITLYLIASCGIWFNGTNLPALLASWLLIHGSGSLMVPNGRRSRFTPFFKGGLTIGAGMLLYAPAVLWPILIPMCLRLFGRSGREAAVAVIGCALPVLACAYTIWAGGDSFGTIFSNIWNDIVYTCNPITLSGSVADMTRIAAIGVSALLLLFSLWSIMMTPHGSRMRAYSVYMLLLLVVVAVPLALRSRCVSDMTMLAVPFSGLATLFFARNPGKFSGVLYFLLIFLVVALNVIELVL